MALLEVKDYSFSYPPVGDSQPVPILDHVSFSLEKGSFCLLTGPTGCGKTTLLRSCKPELAPYGEAQGTIMLEGATMMVDGRPSDAWSARQSALRVGFVMQDPEAQIVCDTVWHELAFGLENLGVEPDIMRRRIAEVAHFFGIESWIGKDTSSLSGGQKQLVNLAGVLVARPTLLLLDEPCAQLDPNAVKQFLFLLSRVNRELGVTVLLATHSPEEMQPFANCQLNLGLEDRLGSRSELERKLRSERAERLVRSSGTESPAITCKQLYVRYDRDDPWVLRGVDLALEQACIHAIVGGNGCGKTTLLKAIAQVVKSQRGSVVNTLHASQALLPQDPKALFVCDSVIEELGEWSLRCGYGRQDELDMLSRVGLSRMADYHPFDLSGGQQQKLAFAKVLLTKPKLLLLDEPTKGLDPPSAAWVSRMLRALADQGTTVVLVTHDLDFASVTADSVSMLFDGQVVCTEPAEEFFAGNIVYRPNCFARLFKELL